MEYAATIVKSQIRWYQQLCAVLTDETFKAAMWNTMRFSVGMVVLTLAVALLLALALNSKIYLRGLFVLSILPQ